MIDSLLKQVMLACKLKQMGMADVLGCSLNRVKSIASGRVKNLTSEESKALIEKLGVRADWLVTGEGPIFQIERVSTVKQALTVLSTALQNLPDDRRVPASAQLGAFGLAPDSSQLMDALLHVLDV